MIADLDFTWTVMMHVNANVRVIVNVIVNVRSSDQIIKWYGV